MIINHTTLGKIASVILPKSAPVGPAAGVSEVTADRVSLSQPGREAAALLGKLKSLPDTRADKVAQASARLQAGELPTSGSQLAERLLHNLTREES
ncbi:MAG: flagellar biosynthesis anti-sigma factor FlgM [Armatimonadetes bacterium]|nr:flagellar biosynthesis anti-sigma factor FlgM [Armatimonadota bacterium]